MTDRPRAPCVCLSVSRSICPAAATWLLPRVLTAQRFRIGNPPTTIASRAAAPEVRRYLYVAVRVHLLDRWLYEDSHGAPAILTEFSIRAARHRSVSYCSQPTCARLSSLDETHVVVSGMAWAAPAIRISVVPRPESGKLLDPACFFAACSNGVHLTPEEHGLAEARLRAICAGTVLAALLECDGRAAFKVGW